MSLQASKFCLWRHKQRRSNLTFVALPNDAIPKEEIEKIETIFENSFNISTITKIEVLGWHKITENEKDTIEAFLNNAKVFYIDKVIENKAIEIKQSYKMATPDTIIGATALENDLIIVTRNENNFKRLEDIKIYNPFKSSL